MGKNKPLALKLGEFASALQYETLSPELVEKAKVFLLDWIGSAYAGGDKPPAKIASEFASEAGGKEECFVFADGSKNSALMAAFVNGASSHIVEMDDLHRESIFHPAASILPGVFAAAEKERVSGMDLIVGLVAGFEVGIRAAMAAGPSHYHFWHTTATCGTFGAAAGVGRLLGLSAEQTAWALGSAGTQASGLWEFLTDGAMSKQLHTGKASMNGMMAAMLAKRGFTGAVNIFEGEKGFLKATSNDFDEEKLIRGLGEEFMTARNSLKYHASCGHTHSTLDAVQKAKEENPFSPDEVESIHVETYQGALDLLGNVKADSPYSAKFNLPFCVAAIVKFGKADTSVFTEENIKDPEILALMDRVTLRSVLELTAVYPKKWPSRVAIELRDGRTLAAYNEFPKGDPENPLSREEAVDKFKGLTKEALTETQQDALVGKILDLENVLDVGDIDLVRN